MTTPQAPDQTSMQNLQFPSEEIDLFQLLKTLWQGKWIIFVMTIAFAIGSIIYAKSLPNIYRSEVLIAPVSDKKDGLGSLSQLGSLASSFYGINIGSGGGIDKISLAIETMKSRQFLSKFIISHDLMPILFKDQYPIPSIQKACLKLQSMILITTDNKTKMIKIAIEHNSAETAKQMLTWLIAEINLIMKQRDMEEAKKSIDYLNNQISQTSLADIRSTLYQLIEEQTKTMMLVNVREEYIFKTVDPAIAPEQKSKPIRSVICIVGTFLGVALSVSWLLFQNSFFKKNFKN